MCDEESRTWYMWLHQNIYFSAYLMLQCFNKEWSFLEKETRRLRVDGVH